MADEDSVSEYDSSEEDRYIAEYQSKRDKSKHAVEHPNVTRSSESESDSESHGDWEEGSFGLDVSPDTSGISSTPCEKPKKPSRLPMTLSPPSSPGSVYSLFSEEPEYPGECIDPVPFVPPPKQPREDVSDTQQPEQPRDNVSTTQPPEQPEQPRENVSVTQPPDQPEQPRENVSDTQPPDQPEQPKKDIGLVKSVKKYPTLEQPYVRAKPALPWTEKYRPTQAAHLVGNNKSIASLKHWIADRKKMVIGTKYAALIHGGPGLGKTTAASVLLRSEGYEVYDINASDLRSYKALYEEIQRAASYVSPCGKKMAIVLDEIDGAVFSTGDKKSSQEKDRESGGRSRSGVSAVIKFIRECKAAEKTAVETTTNNSNVVSLSRIAPIVCIANDVSSEAMRTLKTECIVLPFYKPWRNSEMVPLINRVCTGENLRLSTFQKDAIISTANGDYRRLVNLLQLYANSPESTPAVMRVKSLVKSSTADVHLSIYEVTRRILCNTRMTRGELGQLIKYDEFMITLMLQENAITLFEYASNALAIEKKKAQRVKQALKNKRRQGHEGEASEALSPPSSPVLFAENDSKPKSAQDDATRVNVDYVKHALMMSDCDCLPEDHCVYMASYGTRYYTRFARTFTKPSDKFPVRFPSYMSTYSTKTSKRKKYGATLSRMSVTRVDADSNSEPLFCSYNLCEAHMFLSMLREKYMKIRGKKQSEARQALKRCYPQACEDDWTLVLEDGKAAKTTKTTKAAKTAKTTTKTTRTAKTTTKTTRTAKRQRVK